MTGSVALDVIIGLVFIYLLYSLLTSLVAEIIATNLGLRARNLHGALCRMLDNEEVVSLLSNKDISGLVNKIYEHPEIKSLAPNRFFSRPSSISAETFARSLVDTLKNGNADKKISDLKAGIKSYRLPSSIEDYLLNLADEAGGDISKFSEAIQNWFDNTMINATEWYKRNMQVMLFIIGLFIAWFFNVDTIGISKKLSVDKDARAQLVQLASSYIESNHYQARFDSVRTLNSVGEADFHVKMDSLLAIKDDLVKEISVSHSIIGGGTWLPDAIRWNEGVLLTPDINALLLPAPDTGVIIQKIGFGDKVLYAFKMLWKNLLGYLITAMALSLGAPFWFDVLNKLMKLKSAISHKSKQQQ